MQGAGEVRLRQCQRGLQAQVALVCLVASALAGCHGTSNPNAISRRYYAGPTESMSEVVSAINANNSKIPSLWASHDYEATLVGEDHKSHFLNGDGVLLYRSPTDLRLVAQKDLLGTVFDLGTNSKSYWFKVIPEVDTLWEGRYADLAEQRDSGRRIPIEPDMILQVLGVQPINLNFSDIPAPTMRFNNDADVYMFIWNVRLPDRWAAQREVWYDRQTKAPLYVFLFDAAGRVVLRAQLSEYRKIPAENLPESNWPSMATQYRLYFPDNGSRINFSLKEIQLRKGSGPRAVPNDRSFVPPDPEHAGVGHVITIR